MEEALLQKPLYRQMATLNKTARDIMLRFRVHSCTDVTGFSLMGHSYEMAQGAALPFTSRAAGCRIMPRRWELAEMGFIPRGRNTATATLSRAACA